MQFRVIFEQLVLLTVCSFCLLSYASDEVSTSLGANQSQLGFAERLLEPQAAPEPEAAVESNTDENQAAFGDSNKDPKITTSLRSDDPVSSKWPVVLLSLILILSLIFVLGWLTRRMGGFKTMGKEMTVLATMPMGSRERIALIEVSGQKLLLGITAQQITLLHTFGSGEDVNLSANWSDSDLGQTSSGQASSNEFMQTLKAAVSRQVP